MSIESTTRERWASRGFFEKNRDARDFVEDLLDEVDALSARLAQECALRAQAEQERDEALQQRDHDYARFSEAKRGVIDESKSVMVERDRAERAEARLRVTDVLLREYEEALKLANGSSRRTDDPGCIWIRFPDEAWEVIKPR